MAEHLCNAIVEFLNSAIAEAGTASAMVFCHKCGSAVDYRMSTFFYEGQTWEVPLPICVKCHPILRVCTHDA